MRRPFIVFEGIDGCGKTTQLQLLADTLYTAGVPHIKTFQPGGGDTFGEWFRTIVVGPVGASATPLSRQLLYWADRHQHAHELIIPHMMKSFAVLCDRYTMSTLAYGHCDGIPNYQLVAIAMLVESQCRPDLYVYLRVNPDEAHRRAAERDGDGNHYDRKKAEFYRRLSLRYDHLAKTPSDWGGTPVITIQANGPIAEIAKQVKAAATLHFEESI